MKILFISLVLSFSTLVASAVEVTNLTISITAQLDNGGEQRRRIVVKSTKKADQIATVFGGMRELRIAIIEMVNQRVADYEDLTEDQILIEARRARIESRTKVINDAD